MPTTSAHEDFVISSYGRNWGDGALRCLQLYRKPTPEAGFYNVSGMSDFDGDLVAWAGNWICGPRTSLVHGCYRHLI